MNSNKNGGRYSAAHTKAKKRGGKKFSLLVASLMIVALILVGLIFYMLHHIKAANDFKALSGQINQVNSVQTESIILPTPAEGFPDAANLPFENTKPACDSKVESPVAATEPPQKAILPQYIDPYCQNPDLYGWLRIDGTVIDYPVMRSIEEPEKYLHANFKGEYSYAGTPFVDYKCSYESDNLLIYGHNMLDGSMFRSLLKYQEKNFWEAHPNIMYSDLYGEYEYEVMSAFYDRVYKKTETCFKFYQFIDAENEQNFNESVATLKSKSLYDTGVEAQYGDQLITLITCAYHETNGRFVVVARKADD